MCSRAFPRPVKQEIVDVQSGTISLGLCHGVRVNLRATSRRSVASMSFRVALEDGITYSYVCDGRRAMTRFLGGARMQVVKIKSIGE